MTSRSETLEAGSDGGERDHSCKPVGVIGKLPFNDQFRLEDAVALVNGNGFGTQADDTPIKSPWGRLGVRYANKAADLSLRLGVSGAIGDQLSEADPGPPPVPSERFQFKRFGADFELDQRGLAVSEAAASGCWRRPP